MKKILRQKNFGKIIIKNMKTKSLRMETLCSLCQIMDKEYQSYSKAAHVSIISIKSSGGWFPITPEQIISYKYKYLILKNEKI